MRQTQLNRQDTSFNHSFNFTIDRVRHNFVAARSYFDALNQDRSHFTNSNDICTPMDCVKEMVDSLPPSFWRRKNLKILDSCCGNGNFHGYIATKVGLKHLYFNEINPRRIANVKAYFGSSVNIINKDFMSFNDSTEYDLVVSNPPYAKFNENGRTSKNHNLARDFIKKALDITKKGGYILFIVPNNWMSFSDRNILPQELSKYQFMHINIHGAKKWFPKVGSSFTWFLLKKSPNHHSFTVSNNYVLKDTRELYIEPQKSFIPLYLSQQVMDILAKTVNNPTLPKYKVETTSYLHRTTKKEYLSNKKDKLYFHKIVHTPTKTIWSRAAHKYQKGWKVFISLTNQYGTFIDNCGMTQSIAFIRCKDKQEALKVDKEINREFYRFVNNLTRYGNFNNIRVLQNFPVWGSFKLNAADIKLINSFNRNYYGKTEK